MSLVAQILLEDYRKFLDLISKYYGTKGLEKDDAFDQAYLFLIDEYSPGIKRESLERRVCSRMRGYHREWSKIRVQKADIGDDPDIFDNVCYQMGKHLKPNKRRYGELYKTLDKLDPELKEILELYYFDQWSDEGIAEKLNVSRFAVYRRRQKALDQCRKMMGVEIDGGQKGVEVAASKI